MNAIKNKCFALSLLALLAVCIVITGSTSVATAGSGEQIYIIANNSFPSDALSPAEIKRIFLKEKTRISGKAVVPVNAKKDSALRKAFANRVLGMSPSEELGYWQEQKVQSGKQPPAELGNTMRAVFALKTGISYCFESEYKPGAAKVLYKL